MIMLKFFLHISYDEQERRLLAREQDKDKSWKLSAEDWEDRKYWKDYEQAYEDALSKCSTDQAPWYIVPANHKWRSEEHTSELQSQSNLVCRLLLEKKK